MDIYSLARESEAKMGLNDEEKKTEMKMHKWHTILNSFANLHFFSHEKLFPLYSKIVYSTAQWILPSLKVQTRNCFLISLLS